MAIFDTKWETITKLVVTGLYVLVLLLLLFIFSFQRKLGYLIVLFLEGGVSAFVTLLHAFWEGQLPRYIPLVYGYLNCVVFFVFGILTEAYMVNEPLTSRGTTEGATVFLYIALVLKIIDTLLQTIFVS